MGVSINIGSGIGIGNILAAILSWHICESIGWTLFHALLGWFYVIYYLCVYWH
jgi:hypothetical protein